jgi:hypothetical protein
MPGPPQIIFLTAAKQVVIDACLSKLRSLIGHYQSLPGPPTTWLEKVKIEPVRKSSNRHLPARPTSNTYIYVVTVFQACPSPITRHHHGSHIRAAL